MILGLPLAILVALLVSRRVRDGRWRAVLRVTLAVYRPWPFPWANVIPFDTIGASAGCRRGSCSGISR